VLLLLLVPIWFITEARRSSTSNAAQPADTTCTAAALPFFGIFVSQCSIMQAAVWAGSLAAAGRTAIVLQLLIRPAWHVQRRTAMVLTSWLLDVTVRLLLQLLHCSTKGSCSSMLLLDACMAVTFIMYHMPFSIALPCCSGYWVACAVLQHAAAPGLPASEYAGQLLLQLVLPLVVLYSVQRRARLEYLSVLRRTQQQQQRQASHNDSMSSGSISQSDTPGTSKAAAPPSAAGAAAEAVQATDSDGAGPAAAMQAAAAANPQPAGDADAASDTPTASLVYESPLLHRTVAIKVTGWRVIGAAVSRRQQTGSSLCLMCGYRFSSCCMLPVHLHGFACLLRTHVFVAGIAG
jgi:hypothetical protein